MIIHKKFINNTIICNERKRVDLDALNLLASGKTEELCLCAYKSEKGHHHFVYDTNGMIPIAELVESLSFEDILQILASAFALVKFVMENKLTVDNIQTSEDCIFKSGYGFKFIYSPIVHKQNSNIKDYFLKLISITRSKDLRIIGLKKELCKKKSSSEIIACIEEFLISFDAIRDTKKTAMLTDESETSILSYEGETTLLSASEYETTVLSPQTEDIQDVSAEDEGRKSRLFLIRSKTGEKILIKETPFAIGKDDVNVDYVLVNESISRHHATIFYEDSNYFIMDNQSTNGTIIEGVKLQPYEKAELGSGYIVLLGNETFQTLIERR